MDHTWRHRLRIVRGLVHGVIGLGSYTTINCKKTIGQQIYCHRLYTVMPVKNCTLHCWLRIVYGIVGHSPRMVCIYEPNLASSASDHTQKSSSKR